MKKRKRRLDKIKEAELKDRKKVMQVVTNISKGSKYGVCNMMGCNRPVSLIYNNVNEDIIVVNVLWISIKRILSSRSIMGGMCVNMMVGSKKELKKKKIYWIV